MEPESKKRKVHRAPPRRTGSSPNKAKELVATSVDRSMVHVPQSDIEYIWIQQAKNHAVAQAQQEGCMGNFKIFDSQFGNYLVPVIPTRIELGVGIENMDSSKHVKRKDAVFAPYVGLTLGTNGCNWLVPSFYYG